MENEVFGKMKTLYSDRLGARSGHPPDACFFDRAEKEFGEFKSMWGMEDLVVGAGGGDDDESKGGGGGGDDDAPPSALRTSVKPPLNFSTSSSTLEKEKTLEMDTGNIAKYTQGSRVEGLGESSDISGVVRRVQPATAGATTGPGKIFLLLDRAGASGDNPNAAGNSAARVAAVEQAKYNSMLKKKKIAARVAFGGAGGGGFITELESKNTTNGPPERLAVCMPCYNEDFFEIEATASDITMMVRAATHRSPGRRGLSRSQLLLSLTHSLTHSLPHSLPPLPPLLVCQQHQVREYNTNARAERKPCLRVVFIIIQDGIGVAADSFKQAMERTEQSMPNGRTAPVALPEPNTESTALMMHYSTPDDAQAGVASRMYIIKVRARSD